MDAKVILHVQEAEAEALRNSTSTSLYARIATLILDRGGMVLLAKRFPPREPDGDLHIVDNGLRPRPDTLMAATAYLDGFWHLDPQGVLADSSLGTAPFRSRDIPRDEAYRGLRKLRARFLRARHTRYARRQRASAEDLPEGAIVVFLQGPAPYKRRQAHLPPEEMLRAVLAGAGGRPVIVKPHPLQRREGRELIERLRAEGFDFHVTEANVHDVLARAAVTVSVNSACAVEGFLHQVPAVLFGRADFARMAETVTRAEDFAPALARALSARRPYAAFLTWYFGQCFWLEDPDLDAKILARFAEMGFDAARLGLNPPEDASTT